MVRCVICGALIAVVAGETVTPPHAWAEPQGCVRLVGCEHRPTPHPVGEGPQGPGSDDTAKAPVTVSTSASTMQAGVWLPPPLGMGVPRKVAGVPWLYSAGVGGDS